MREKYRSGDDNKIATTDDVERPHSRVRTLKTDFVAGIHVESNDGEYLGVTMGPVRENMVYSLDETGDEPVRNVTPWEQVRIIRGPRG